jgi:hypothetical protein
MHTSTKCFCKIRRKKTGMMTTMTMEEYEVWLVNYGLLTTIKIDNNQYLSGVRQQLNNIVDTNILSNYVFLDCDGKPLVIAEENTEKISKLAQGSPKFIVVQKFEHLNLKICTECRLPMTKYPNQIGVSLLDFEYLRSSIDITKNRNYVAYKKVSHSNNKSQSLSLTSNCLVRNDAHYCSNSECVRKYVLVLGGDTTLRQLFS